MVIHTVNFGDLEVPDDKIITFKEGLPGFPQIHRFIVLEKDDLKPFQYLQALDDPPIALLIVNPFLIDPGYEFRLTDSDMEEVKSTSATELAVYAVTTIPEDPAGATLNLMAPIVINHKEKLGKQTILLETKYSVKHPLLSGAVAGETKVQGA